jgi:hypothetical protein
MILIWKPTLTHAYQTVEHLNPKNETLQKPQKKWE